MRTLLLPLVSMALVLAASPVAAKEQRAGQGQTSDQTQATTLPQPKLIVAISVDQFSADLFAEYRQHFTGGLARMLSGAVFASGFQSHAATETCPGHSTILTGARPARTGIIANHWIDPTSSRADKRVYCSEDVTDPASDPDKPVVSSRHLRVPTLGDRLKSANRASRVVAVSGKDRGAIMMGGHNIDQAWWWRDGAFVTLKGRSASPVAAAVSAEEAEARAKGAPALPVPAWCVSKERAIAVGNGSVGTGRFERKPGNDSDFRVSPAMDQAVLRLGANFADSMQLGKGKATDVLAVSLSATDYVGHGTGTEGVEMCIQMAELDRALGTFFDRLDATGADYVAVLTADHGGLDMPERLREQGYPEARRVDGSTNPGALGRLVTEKTGISAANGPLLYSDGPFGDFYVSKDVSAADKPRVVAALIDVAKANPQVETAFSAQEIAATPSPSGSPQDWSLLQRARASYDAERSGDVVILLKRGVVPIEHGRPGRVATHGSPWDYDRRVPILFWRKGLTGLEQPRPVETVDIAPTLAALIGLRVPAGEFDGRCLDIDGSPADSCAAVVNPSNNNRRK